LSRAQQANSGGTASQQQLADCRYRADMAQATLQQTRESLDKTRALMIEQNKEFIKLLTEQQSLKLDQVRYVISVLFTVIITLYYRFATTKSLLPCRKVSGHWVY
jgi:acyl-CoA reductase-like NAD-dependent aldehyde dehydrogenase